ncbi:hypothetical protein [Novosphingobium capsulatum]|uniref:hypothetical protein n=1 Tax=Novosphingobium capsulatum TaxID=13688 RepID=UPI0007895BA8|nr:hypothetical protein [Novosphingobium capsulatum]WQD93671.1 hypothetical protein U0041_03510 [Novosphingobium capsulatum]
MIALAWMLPLLRRLAPWIGMVLLALACHHFATLARLRAQDLASQAASYHAAQRAAQAQAQAALARDAERYRQLAHVEETRHDQELETARAAAVRFAATHRVQPVPATGAGGTPFAAAAPHPAGIRESLPAAGIVVSQDDVQACSEVTAYALSLRDWALDVSAPTVALPAGAP